MRRCLEHQHHEFDSLQQHTGQEMIFELAFPHRMTMQMQFHGARRSVFAPITTRSGLASSMSFDHMLACWTENDCTRVKCCRINLISKHALFAELIELVVFASLPHISIRQ